MVGKVVSIPRLGSETFESDFVDSVLNQFQFIPCDFLAM